MFKSASQSILKILSKTPIIDRFVCRNLYPVAVDYGMLNHGSSYLRNGHIDTNIPIRVIHTCFKSVFHHKRLLCQVPQYSVVTYRELCSKFIDDVGGSIFETLEEEEEEVEGEDIDNLEEVADSLLGDAEFNESVRQFCSIPDAGHRLFVIQPVERSPKSKQLSTGALQLEEAEALVKSIPNWTVVKSELLNVSHINSQYIFGSGQFQTLTEQISRAPGVSAVFVAVDHLNKMQLKNLQRKWGLPVLDRYSVVIQIFKAHAKTHAAKLQVALAEVPFLRSRLEEMQAGMFDNQTGGAQFVGGSGDHYLTARSVFLQRRERKIRKALAALKKQRCMLREHRLRKEIPTVAVVGYTNSGKTTLIRALTGDESLVPCNQLFATLDVTVHAGHLPNTMLALYVDTVGFISNIPTHLINAFSATLEDAMAADLILHVRDISHPNTTAQKHNVVNTIHRMLTDVQRDTMVEVCNKVDLLQNSDSTSTSCTSPEKNVFCVSAVTGEGLDLLRLEIQRRLLTNMGFLQKRLKIPLAGPHLSWLYKMATVISTETDSDTESLIVDVAISLANYSKFQAKFGKPRKSRVNS